MGLHDFVNCRAGFALRLQIDRSAQASRARGRSSRLDHRRLAHAEEDLGHALPGLLGGEDVLAASGSGIDSGLYDSARSDETFDFLLETAGALLLAGEHVIVDATFMEKARRQRFVNLATGLGSQATILHCQASQALLETRLVARAAAGGDPSEADVRVLHLQLERFEPPGAEEPVVRVDTAEPLTESVVSDLATAILDGGLDGD
jgi:predicted kinase